MRILCLHGYTQSANLFAKKASGLRKILKKHGHDLIFVDAPIKVDLSDLPFEPSPDMAEADMRAWWITNEASDQYCNMNEAFASIKSTLKQDGPFDGLIGFSQGAGLTAILTKAVTQLVPEHPSFKFAIMYSGFCLKSPSAQHWYQDKFITPSLHVIGTLDTVVSEERSLKLVECWDPVHKTILRHPGGHYTPNQRPMLEAVLSFVQGQVPQEATASEKTASPQLESTVTSEAEEWDEFDNIGK